MAYSFQELTQIARQAGWGDEAELAAAIALGESSGDPTAHNPRYPDDSYGLMQINMLDLPDYQLGAERRARYGLRSNEELKDPVLNMRIAKDIRDSQGLNAWSVYSSGTANKILEQQASAVPSQPVSAPPPVPVGQDQQRNFIQRGIDGVLRFFGADTDPKIPGSEELDQANQQRNNQLEKSEQALVREQMDSILGALVAQALSGNQLPAYDLDQILASDEAAALAEEQAQENNKALEKYKNAVVSQQEQINQLKNVLAQISVSQTPSNTLDLAARAFANQARPVA